MPIAGVSEDIHRPPPPMRPIVTAIRTLIEVYDRPGSACTAKAPRRRLFENLYSTAETRMTDISMYITPTSPAYDY
ncbi:hypothetical protein C8039_05650 [Halogeometricum sp. wsp3]|nr:hypothetical protein C8039_05650 [Halogeometricum sp. wsp3]